MELTQIIKKEMKVEELADRCIYRCCFDGRGCLVGKPLSRVDIATYLSDLADDEVAYIEVEGFGPY